MSGEARVTVQTERERVIARLSDAFAEDALALEEFERRLALARGAVDVADLRELVRDLPQAESIAPVAPSSSAALVPAAHVRDRQTIVAFMSGNDRKGEWIPPRRMRVVAIMGG